MRIADDHVAAAKHGSLRTSLGRREEIAELPLASDYDWHAPQPRGWDQGQVRIKIKRLRNRDLVPVEMAGQAETGPPRLQSVQTTA